LPVKEVKIIHPDNKPIRRMTATLREWGNSMGLRLPKQIVREAALKPGATFSVAVEPDGTIRLVPAKPRATIEELCAEISPKNRHVETEWGPPAGREVW
jgi:antitoxin MazE